MVCRGAGDDPGISSGLVDCLVQVQVARNTRKLLRQRVEALLPAGDKADQFGLGQAGEGKGMKSTETAKAEDGMDTQTVVWTTWLDEGTVKVVNLGKLRQELCGRIGLTLR